MSTSSTSLDQALALLRAGELVGIPTETVYGLAADAGNPEAIAKIFAAKGRPADHPVIVHIAGKEQLADWATDIPDAAWQLAEAFWPGPLTLILPRKASTPLAVTGGQDSVGVRAPAHPLTHELLKQFRGGLAAPSANQFGHVSPTTAQHVRDEFDTATLQLVLDGGPCEVGVESTIVSLIGAPKLLRPGGVPREAIETLLGIPLEHHQSASSAKIRASGLLDSHYSPRTPLLTGPLAVLRAEASERAEAGQKVLLLSFAGTAPQGVNAAVLPDDPEQFARDIYATLRHYDRKGFAALLLESPPQTPAWLAVNDRLRRAAHQKLGG